MPVPHSTLLRRCRQIGLTGQEQPGLPPYAAAVDPRSIFPGEQWGAVDLRLLSYEMKVLGLSIVSKVKVKFNNKTNKTQVSHYFLKLWGEKMAFRIIVQLQRTGFTTINSEAGLKV